jgi:hexosaminidase
MNNMEHYGLKGTLTGLICFLILFCHSQTAFGQGQDISIIPEPAQMQAGDGEFSLSAATPIVIPEDNSELDSLAGYLSDKLHTATWVQAEIINETAPEDSAIVLALDSQAYTDQPEAYTLSVKPEQVKITAGTANGLFYGIQSLLQLMPSEIYMDDPSLVPNNVEWALPAVEIEDEPRFEYRGMHLDVARHFFPVSFVKKYIDMMAMHKLNRFHWHLTEDQGWRIEIKKYPKLTEVGAWRDSTLIGHYTSEKYDDIRYGGFYTQDEIREVVQYAKERYVMVVPEIEMPGHASAALTAYPELGCEPDKAYKLQPTWGIFEDIFCPREQTFTFLEDVLTEVMELFPSEYIHIGGDEAPKTAWEESDFAQGVIEREGLEDEHELQSYFITRMEKFLNSNGRQIIGWDEILEGGLAPNATVMSWRGEEGGIKAAQQGNNVIMTPISHLYLDYYQGEAETEPLAIGNYIPLEKTYSYEPIPDTLTEEESEFILGAQGNLWTEYIHTGNKVEYMVYPRGSALAEVVWSPKEKRSWDSFLQRLQTQFKRFEYLEVNAAEHYRESAKGTSPPKQ